MDVEVVIEFSGSVFDDKDFTWRRLAICDVLIERTCDDGSHVGLELILRLEEVVRVKGGEIFGRIHTV